MIYYMLGNYNFLIYITKIPFNLYDKTLTNSHVKDAEVQCRNDQVGINIYI